MISHSVRSYWPLALLAIYLWVLPHQVRRFSSNMHLWSDAVIATPTLARPWANLALAQQAAGLDPTAAWQHVVEISWAQADQ